MYPWAKNGRNMDINTFDIQTNGPQKEGFVLTEHRSHLTHTRDAAFIYFANGIYTLSFQINVMSIS